MKIKENKKYKSNIHFAKHISKMPFVEMLKYFWGCSEGTNVTFHLEPYENHDLLKGQRKKINSLFL